MAANIFSTYSTGENRVTASILAVLQALSLERIERILGVLLEQSEFELVRFQNQAAEGGGSVPDAIISSSLRLLIETKVKTNAVQAEQLNGHLAKLKAADEASRVLLVLTPDPQIPAVIEQADEPMLAWASFAMLDQAIDELLGDSREVVSEREAFLLRELQEMLLREKLLSSNNDVVVVAARDAWPRYEKYGAYICQPNRAFRPVQRMGFYSAGRIRPLIPRILSVHEAVEFSIGRHSGVLGKLVDSALQDGIQKEGQISKVVFLSPPKSPETTDLGHEIVNDLKTEAGGTWAFTLSQRYVSLDQLKKARTTSQLVKG